MGQVRFGPSEPPIEGDFDEAAEALSVSGYTAVELGFVGGFWLDYDAAPQLAEALRARDIAVSVHAPLAAFMGHADRGKKFKMALGMLDHTAGLAKAFGVEVMGRVRDFGTLDDVLAIASQVDFVRPVLDFAHMHATSDGAYTDVDSFASALEAADEVMGPDEPFHIHFSDIAYANRNETKHLPYGEGTLRAEPLRDALTRFDRPATVISESPDEESTQTIGAVLAGASAARRSS
jgi:endonuclease IV